MLWPVIEFPRGDGPFDAVEIRARCARIVCRKSANVRQQPGERRRRDGMHSRFVRGSVASHGIRHLLSNVVCVRRLGLVLGGIALFAASGHSKKSQSNTEK